MNFTILQIEYRASANHTYIHNKNILNIQMINLAPPYHLTAYLGLVNTALTEACFKIILILLVLALISKPRGLTCLVPYLP